MTTPLISLDLTVDATGESGRVFTHSPEVFSSLGVVEERFVREFADDDDRARLALIRRALKKPVVSMDVYRGEEAPYEIHVYISAAEPGSHPLFACVLFPPAVLTQSLEEPNAVVAETATMQVIDGMTEAAIVAGLERWCERVCRTKAPTFLVNPWPTTFIDHEGGLELLKLFPVVEASKVDPVAFTDSRPRFVPALDLAKDKVAA